MNKSVQDKSLGAFPSRTGVLAFLLTLVVLILFSSPAPALSAATIGQRTEAPLNEQYVSEVLRKHAVGDDFLIETIKQRGVDFQLTDAVKERLSRYGATAELMDAINDNYKAPSGDTQALMPGMYEGKIGKGDDAKHIKLEVRDNGIKLEGSIQYDKAKGSVTNGLLANGDISVEFQIGKDKGVINGHYKDGRISGEMTYGGKVEKVRLRWSAAIQSPQ